MFDLSYNFSLDGGAWSGEDWAELPLALSSHMLAGGKKQYYLDFETALYLLGGGNNGRYYDAATARFVNEDPTRQAGGGPNLYAYVHANPVNHLDPSGHAGDGKDKDKEKAKPTPPANDNKSAQPGQGANPLSRRQQHDLERREHNQERRERYLERAEARAERRAQRHADREAHQMHRGHETDPWWQATLDSQYGPLVSDRQRQANWSLQHPMVNNLANQVGGNSGGEPVHNLASLAGVGGDGQHSQDTTPKSTDAVPTENPPTAGPNLDDDGDHQGTSESCTARQRGGRRKRPKNRRWSANQRRERRSKRRPPGGRG